MHKKKITIALLMIALPFLLGACVPSATPPLPTSPTPSTPAENTPQIVSPEDQPAHQLLNFELSTDTTPGNTDEYDTYSFNIYLETGQELIFEFSATGANVMVSALTPAEEKWGYHPPDPDPEDATDTGYLEKGRTFAADNGSFRYSVPVTGYYLFTVKSATPQGNIDVLVEYNIQ